MDSNFAFSLAAMPENQTVLRLPLLPFSIGHRLLLERIRSPFLPQEDPARKPRYSDLLQAVLFCADTFEAGADLNQDIFARAKIWLWQKRLRGIDPDKEMIRFQNYLSLGSLGPRLKPTEGRAPGAPWTLRLKNFVQYQLGKTESEAWNFPYGRAQFEWAAYWEEKGGLKIYNQEELDWIAQCDRMDAEEEAKAATETKGAAHA